MPFDEVDQYLSFYDETQKEARKRAQEVSRGRNS